MKNRNFRFITLSLVTLLGLCGCAETSDNSSGSEGESGNLVETTLATLQSSTLAYKGDLSMVATYSESGEFAMSSDTTIEGYIASDQYFNLELDEEGNELYKINYYANQDTGYVETRFLSPLTNEEDSLELVNTSTGQPGLLSSHYFNPWTLLTSDFLTLNDDNTITVGGPQAFKEEIFRLLTAYVFSVSMDITINLNNDGSINNIYFELEEFESYGYDENFTYYDYLINSSFTMYLVDVSEISLPTFEPRERTSDHDALESLFSRLSQNNYSMHFYASSSSGSSYEDTVIQVNDDIVLVDNFYGYLDVDGAPAEFQLSSSEGALVGSAPIDTSASFFSYLPSFAILPEMFDYDANENKYKYANLGTEEFLYYYMTPYNLLSYTYLPDEDSFAIAITEEEGEEIIKITYTTTFSYYELAYITLNVEITISNIGATEIPYDINDYIEYSVPEGWDDVVGATELLAEYGITNQLPFFLLEGGNSWRAYQDGYLTTTFVGEDTTILSVVNILIEAGWVYRGIDFNTYLYEFIYYLDDTHYVQISIGGEFTYDSSYTAIAGTIYIYLDGTFEASALELWFSDNDNFSDTESYNYTMYTKLETSTYSTYYDNDSSSYIDDELVSQVTTDKTVYFTEDAYMDNEVAYVNSNDGVKYYSYDSDSGYYNYSSTNTEISHYDSLITYSIYHLVHYASIEPTGDNYYTFNNFTQFYAVFISGLVNYSEVNNYDDYYLYFDSTDEVLTITLELDLGYYQEGDTYYHKKGTLTLVFYDVGDTSIDTNLLQE